MENALQNAHTLAHFISMARSIKECSFYREYFLFSFDVNEMKIVPLIISLVDVIWYLIANQTNVFRSHEMPFNVHFNRLD